MEGLSEHFNEANIERPKWRYTYSSGDKSAGRPVVFECKASDDLEADELYQKFKEEKGLKLSESDIRRSAVRI
ncbi:MAG: hypothetical protein A2541_02845 [Candidatus Taylorbacteria bacterium RIFOXYD2_FULL_36_9]|uniref:Uncharacterized protein n=1 Tax=Candidatus Taylorbacteria bacterium RIFOXYD2_FULL_36_9 TaxID=1802338 RepID=A0A1G2PE86_9BACT|nr:MAG: hypothetical protein A2541_02845 [Candidatus Taylorbacteria bacterium RIFOXYD2_FULL_36_9]